MTESGGIVTPALVAAALRGYPLSINGVHGPGHWLRVLANGRALAVGMPGADPLVVELFALFHDCRRADDGRDPGHGERAAAYVRRLATEAQLRDLDAGRLELLIAACARHELGDVSTEPTIGCCWDADQLELTRLWRRPLPRLLSTAAALEPALQAAAWARGEAWMVDGTLAQAWGFDPGAWRRVSPKGVVANLDHRDGGQTMIRL
jgi:uncharacterized protein